MVELAFSWINLTKQVKNTSTWDISWYKENLLNNLNIDDWAIYKEYLENLMNKNSSIIQQKDQIIAKDPDFKNNYDMKTNIINKIDIGNIKRIQPLEDKEKESIINKAIIMEFLSKLEDEYNRRKDKDGHSVQFDRRMANLKEINNWLEEDLLTNNTLDGISKILKWERYNFDGIIIEEGTRSDFIYENSDGTLSVNNEEIKWKDPILKKGDKVLVRHLEGKKIDIETMQKALKDGIHFFEKHYSDYMEDVKYLTSWSRLWNKDFRDFYEKITEEKSTANQTREWTEKIGGKFIAGKDARKEDWNDRFIQMKWIPKAKRTEKLEEIKNWIIKWKWIVWLPTKMETEFLVEERNKQKNQPKISKLCIARALYWPISSTVCVIPIENLKKL